MPHILSTYEKKKVYHTKFGWDDRSISCNEKFISFRHPFFTTGIKIGEITATSAIVWARLTANEFRVKDTGIHPTVLYWDDLVNEWHEASYFDKNIKWAGLIKMSR